jgi:hypothetical protein
MGAFVSLVEAFSGTEVALLLARLVGYAKLNRSTSHYAVLESASNADASLCPCDEREVELVNTSG